MHPAVLYSRKNIRRGGVNYYTPSRRKVALSYSPRSPWRSEWFAPRGLASPFATHRSSKPLRHHSEATPRPQEDEAEQYLLLLRFLEGSSCTAAFEALKREAVEHGLLGSRTDWTGASRPTTYERELDRRAPSLPSEHLPQLLDMVQRLSRERVRMCPPHMPGHTCLPSRAPPCIERGCARASCRPVPPRVRRSPLRLACPPRRGRC